MGDRPGIPVAGLRRRRGRADPLGWRSSLDHRGGPENSLRRFGGMAAASQGAPAGSEHTRPGGRPGARRGRAATLDHPGWHADSKPSESSGGTAESPQGTALFGSGQAGQGAGDRIGQVHAGRSGPGGRDRRLRAGQHRPRGGAPPASGGAGALRHGGQGHPAAPPSLGPEAGDAGRHRCASPGQGDRRRPGAARRPHDDRPAGARPPGVQGGEAAPLPTGEPGRRQARCRCAGLAEGQRVGNRHEPGGTLGGDRGGGLARRPPCGRGQHHAGRARPG